jgi:hypothetical protein
MTIAAEATLRMHGPDEVEPMLREVVERAPAFSPANMLLANLMVAQLRLHEAADALEAFRTRAPHETNALRYLADVRNQMNDPFGAALLYEEVLARQPNSSADEFKYAQILRYAGRKAESVSALRRAIALSPLGGHAWWPLVHHFPDDVTKEDETQLRGALTTPGVPPEDLALLHAAVSILDHRYGNHQAAFYAIASAKAVRSASSKYNPVALNRHVDDLIAAYTPDVFERLRPSGSVSDSPVFIVGLPRSGSTLLERILGRHSMIEPLGEIPVLPRVVAREQTGKTASYRSLLPESLTDEKLGEMAGWYLERSQEYRRSDKPRFIDKYNGNWIRAGLIRLMFPNAKILDMRRDPLDCCWAVFRSFLVGDYANDQRHLGRYYADYVRFMDAMAASPANILTVSYEALVADVEKETRLILDFLGLDFEAACVDFHLSTAAVTTASSEQVRRPINSEGIGSAEPYRPWLRVLIAELDSALAKSA